MRIQNLTITKQNNIDVIRYDLSASDEYDDTIYDKVVTADNIFNYQYDDRGGVRSITSYANRGMPLDVLMKNTLTKKQVCSVLRGLISILELDAKGIPSSGIVLNPKYIYVDGEGLSVKCVCIPLKPLDALELKEITGFIKSVIMNMRFAEEGGDNYIAGMITLLNSADFSISGLRNFIDGQINSINLNSNSQPLHITMTQNEMGLVPGALMGQLGKKPIPHMVRKKTGEIINITKSVFVIGKSKTRADYTIENNPAISREHCIIVQKDGVNYIKDNNSTNHTFINGVELEPDREVLLKNKTIIQLGDEEFTFLLRKGE